MLIKMRNRKGQNTAEYAVLISLVVAAVIGVQTYVKRGIQARYKVAGDDYFNTVVGKTGDAGISDAWSQISTVTVDSASTQWEFDKVSSQSTQNIAEDSSDYTMEYDGSVDRDNVRRSSQAVGDHQTVDY